MLTVNRALSKPNLTTPTHNASSPCRCCTTWPRRLRHRCRRHHLTLPLVHLHSACCTLAYTARYRSPMTLSIVMQKLPQKHSPLHAIPQQTVMPHMRPHMRHRLQVRNQHYKKVVGTNITSHLAVLKRLLTKTTSIVHANVHAGCCARCQHIHSPLHCPLHPPHLL